MDDRKEKILRAVVEDYIKYAEPVGSKTIEQKHGLGYSSATIRNEMALLEREGFLEQPHTSSGRVPSTRGYRYYVDNIMKDTKLSMVDINYINNSISGYGNMEDVISQTTEILSSVLKQPTVMSVEEHDLIESVKVVNITDKMLLVVLIGQGGKVKDCIIKLHEGLTQEILVEVNRVFNSNLKGVPFDKLKEVVEEYVKRELSAYSEVVAYIVNAVCNEIDTEKRIVKDNMNYMLTLPEFSDINNVKRFVDILSTESIFESVKEYGKDNDLKIVIGDENTQNDLKDYSIVTLSLKSADDKPIANIGVIGPKRMDYKRVVSTMKYLGDKIKKVLTVSKEDKDVKKGNDG